MKKFSSIESFRNIVTRLRRSNVSVGRPLPMVNYVGTVKLHGTNAGVRVRKDTVQPQSRERLVSIGSDNAGFAQYVLGHEGMFCSLTDYIASTLNVPNNGQFTVFGEWCGGNIQSKVGLNALDKHFVVFNVYDHDNECYLNRDWMRKLLAEGGHTVYNDARIHFILEIPTYSITIDFSEPEQFTEKLTEMTLTVEEKCPWAEYRGAEGIGEGIVWVNADDEGNSDYWLKTKGVKHQGKDKSKVKTLSADPVKVAAIRELVEELLPEWRLEQGIAYLKENGMEVSQKSTGQYLQWVNKDIIKEEESVIAANEYTWKEISPYINQKARDWFFTKLNTDFTNV